ncbi:bifunctional folylpolyglutamate synthase/dihydrofolate synthase [Fictibacillus aquaticus]|uniref:tetrahydrofolate synthase n=1 Tax=Fictibacillus aquaticus TaxID=2021314 RepID=A0A235FBC4_9BACL|nr:folylpolyglutamate synthase/dihydrofolate synthase family protein [Fictibacillus aquaticus]OYD58075.1 hypothetical protein CGZ90_09320 [Fictibacillus aquaticus]
MKSYQEMNEFLGLVKGGRINPGLTGMERLLQKLGNPHDHLKIIHIAGTNGKGSTSAFIQSVLLQSVYSAGSFTSPFLNSVNEHIQFNGESISESDFLRVLNDMKSVMDDEDRTLTEFEAVTAAALYYFGAVAKPDFCIIEAGMGGRWDSTNVVSPILSVITNVGMDHCGFLGNTLQEIAAEKAGIIKSGVHAVAGYTSSEALAVIRQQAEAKQAPLFTWGDDYSAVRTKDISGGQTFTYRSLYSIEGQNYSVSMLGNHQIRNAALALMVLENLQQRFLLNISSKNKAEGLKLAFVPGRFEQMSDHPLVFIDGAHNPEGAAALKNTLKENFISKKIHVIFAVLADKEKEEMLSHLYSAASTLTFTDFEHPRAGSMKEMYEKSSFPFKRYKKDWKAAIAESVESASEDEVIIITGSLYFIAEVRRFLKDFSLYN